MGLKSELLKLDPDPLAAKERIQLLLTKNNSLHEMGQFEAENAQSSKAYLGLTMLVGAIGEAYGAIGDNQGPYTEDMNKGVLIGAAILASLLSDIAEIQELPALD